MCYKIIKIYFMQLKNVSNCFEMFTFLIENEENWVKNEEKWVKIEEIDNII